MISRIALLDNLSKVEPAVSDSTAVPVLCQFWFTGKSLVAFNGIIGISVPCETKFKGGVPKTLKKLLETSAAKEIELTTSDDNGGTLHVKAGKSKLKVAWMPLEDFEDYMTTQPPMPKEAYDVHVEHFTEALTMCMRSIGNEKVRADMMGVTAIADKKHLLLFGFNQATVSFGEVKGSMDAKRAIIPAEWCKQAVTLFADEAPDDVVIEITEQDCLMATKAGPKLWANTLLPDAGELDFVGTILKANEDGEPVMIPERFAAAVERAAIIGKGGVSRVKTSFAIERGGILKMLTKSDAGEVSDEIEFKGHPAITVTADAVRVAEGVDLEDMYFTETALVMRKADGRLQFFISLMD